MSTANGRNLDALVGLPITIRVDWDKEWKAAVCEELEVSGFGLTIDDALLSCARSIRSVIACKANSAICPNEPQKEGA